MTIFSCVLTWWKGKGVLWASFIKAVISFMRALPLWEYPYGGVSLPQSVHLQIPSHWRLASNTWVLKGHKFSAQSIILKVELRIVSASQSWSEDLRCSSNLRIRNWPCLLPCLYWSPLPQWLALPNLSQNMGNYSWFFLHLCPPLCSSKHTWNLPAFLIMPTVTTQFSCHHHAFHLLLPTCNSCSQPLEDSSLPMKSTTGCKLIL